MTRRYIPLCLLFAGALAAGCDSLDQNPVATSSKDAVFGSENGLSHYVNSLYNWMPDANIITQSESMTDYAARRDVPQFIRPGVYSPRVTDLTASGQYEVVALSGDVNWRWNTLRGINYFLASNTNPAVLEKTRNNYNGIARFFRAWFYFEKVKRYGDVPWIDKPPAHRPGAEAEPGVVGVIPGGVEESAPRETSTACAPTFSGAAFRVRLSPVCQTICEASMRPFRLAAVAVALLSVAPTKPLAGQQPVISREALIAMVQNHKGAVLRYIDAAPDSMLGFRPTKGVRNFAEQIEHAAGSDAYIAHVAITGSEKGIPSMGDSAVYLHNKAALKTYAAAAMDHTIGMLRGLSNADMQKNIVQFGHKVTRGRALMELLDHFPWTLGQTVPYLRLNGVTPPEYSPF